MGADKPLISILMAVYEPQMDWLKEQLDSLNAQTYPNLRLYVRDDASPTVPFDEIRRLVRECITEFPVQLERNGKNLGSNGTFELLTREAEGEYFAYCDQDDIWLPEKTQRLWEVLTAEEALLVCSDMYIIDGDGRQISDSITKTRRHHRFRSGTGLTDTLWYSNFASGCALLVSAGLAKASIPWNPYMYYDHYVTLFCAEAGRVVSLPEPLLRHREHGRNQSGLLKGVVDKKSYCRIRVENKLEEVLWLTEHFNCGDDLKKTLLEGKAWLEARKDYLRGNRRKWKIIWKYRRFSKMVSLFEIALPFMPEFLSGIFFEAGRRNAF